MAGSVDVGVSASSSATATSGVSGAFSVTGGGGGGANVAFPGTGSTVNLGSTASATKTWLVIGGVLVAGLVVVFLLFRRK